jgi:hypothetical protein
MNRRKVTFHIPFLLALISHARLAAEAEAEEIAMPEPELSLVAFARDFSNNDKTVVDQVAQFVAAPPNDDETVGFHESSALPAETRAWLATVNLLSDKNHIMPSEDKYCQEVFAIWADEGWLTVDALPVEAKDILRTFRDETATDGDERKYRSFRKVLWQNFAALTEAVEESFRAKGLALLSIDASDGDTMFYAVVNAEIAKRWQGKSFNPVSTTAYIGGIRPPMWDRYWAHLSYAMGPMIVGPENQTGVPPETRQRGPMMHLPLQ